MEVSEVENEQIWKKKVQLFGKDLSHLQQTVSSLARGVSGEPTDMETPRNSLKSGMGSGRSSSFTTANSNVSTSFSVGNHNVKTEEGTQTEPWEKILESHLKSKLEATCHIYIQQKLQKVQKEENDSRELLVSENKELSGLLRYLLGVVNSLHENSLLFPEGQERIKEVFTQLPTKSGGLQKSVEEATRMCQELAVVFHARGEHKEDDPHQMLFPEEVPKQWEATEMEFVEGRLEKKRRRNEPSILERENLETREEEEERESLFNDLQRRNLNFSPKTMSTVCSDEDTFGFPSTYSTKTFQNPPEYPQKPRKNSPKLPKRFQNRRNLKTLSDSSDEDEDEIFAVDQLSRRLPSDSNDRSLLVRNGDLGKLSLYSHHSNNNKLEIQKVIKVPPSVASQIAAARFGSPIPLSSTIVKGSRK